MGSIDLGCSEKCISNPVIHGKWINLIKQGQYPRKIASFKSIVLGHSRARL